MAVLSQISCVDERGAGKMDRLPCQRIELLRWTQFASRLQLALADHVHELDTGKGRGS
jgi:hypothetical protein